MRRRRLLLGALGLGGAFTVGWGLWPMRDRVGSGSVRPDERGHARLNGWITLRPDGGVILAMARLEMGQGVSTALPMLVAEELDIPVDRIELETAGMDRLYGNVTSFLASLPWRPDDRESGGWQVRAGDWIVGKLAREWGLNITAGSTSMADAWPVLRLAAASARASLLGAASLQWRVPREQLRTQDGRVLHPGGRSARYEELAAAAAATPPGEVGLKPREQWVTIGRPVPRRDLPAAVDGSLRYGTDVRLPDMVYASVRFCPILRGSLSRMDDTPARALPGIQRVLRVPAYAGLTEGVAVVARSTWHAQQGAQALALDWRPPPDAPPADATRIEAQLVAAAQGALADAAGQPWHRRGDPAAARAAAAQTLQSTYTAPWLAHLSLEPVNCTAQVREGEVTVWLATQVPGLAREMAAHVAGVPASQVSVHVLPAGGSFGRRLEVDMVAVAVRIARETAGRPVQVLWPRDEDIRHAVYRPAAAAALRAGLAPDGGVMSLEAVVAGEAILPHWLARSRPQGFDLPAALDRTAVQGLYDQAYGFAHQRIAAVRVRSDVPAGYWRSVGHSHHAFFLESFLDELAAHADEDPVAFRHRWLAEAPRHRAVLDLVAHQAGWSPARRAQLRAAGRGLGVALHASFGSVAAQVAEVSVEAGQVRVHRLTCALDCGTVVHPDLVAQQVEGATLFGLSAALYGELPIRDGIVQATNLHDQPMLTLAQSPRVETHLVASTRPPSGVGETATPPVAPAVANAVFHLTGRRLRRLPLAVA